MYVNIMGFLLTHGQYRTQQEAYANTSLQIFTRALRIIHPLPLNVECAIHV